MNTDPLDSLMDALGGGDEAAIERAYLAYEPLLRMIVRRRLSPQLRVRFDSVDIVQSVWADLLDGMRSNRWKFEDAAQLRGFLVQVTSNRLIDRSRQHHSAIERERGPAALAREPAPDSPSEVAQSGELWERMLDACPEPHRDLLRLRREGLTTAEIGARVGLNEGSVRRILGDLARKLACRAAAPPSG